MCFKMTLSQEMASQHTQLLHLLALLLIVQLKFCLTVPQQAFPSEVVEKEVSMCSINAYEHKQKP